MSCCYAPKNVILKIKSTVKMNKQTINLNQKRCAIFFAQHTNQHDLCISCYRISGFTGRGLDSKWSQRKKPFIFLYRREAHPFPFSTEQSRRYDQLRHWVKQGIVPLRSAPRGRLSSVWLGGLYQPLSFLTALKHEKAMAESVSISDVSLKNDHFYSFLE